MATEQASAKGRQGGDYEPPVLAEPAGGDIPEWQDEPDEPEPAPDEAD